MDLDSRRSFQKKSEGTLQTKERALRRVPHDGLRTVMDFDKPLEHRALTHLGCVWHRWGKWFVVK